MKQENLKAVIQICSEIENVEKQLIFLKSKSPDLRVGIFGNIMHTFTTIPNCAGEDVELAADRYLDAVIDDKERYLAKLKAELETL